MQFVLPDFAFDAIVDFARTADSVPAPGLARNLLVACLLVANADVCSEEIEIARDALNRALAEARRA